MIFLGLRNFQSLSKLPSIFVPVIPTNLDLVLCEEIPLRREADADG
jgi:hypothetical protein